MISPLLTWQNDFEKLGGGAQWSSDISNWVKKNSVLKLVEVQGQFEFQFNKPFFEVQLQQIPLSFSKQQATLKFANLLRTSILSSSFLLPPGCCYGVSTPATTFSQCQIIVDPDSLSKMMSVVIRELIQKDLPHAMFKGFNEIRFHVFGMNSLVIPTPLAAMKVGVI